MSAAEHARDLLLALDHSKILMCDSIDTRSRFGFGPVHYVVWGVCTRGGTVDPKQAERFCLTIDCVVSMGFGIDTGSEPLGMTPLAVAALKECWFACRVLVEMGASIPRAYSCIDFRIDEGDVTTNIGRRANRILESLLDETPTQT